jgi:hypothetical protein
MLALGFVLKDRNRFIIQSNVYDVQALERWCRGHECCSTGALSGG